MKRNYFTVVVLIGILLTVSPIHAAEQAKAKTLPIGDYIIGPGDVLDISVWNHADLTRSVTVLPDGKIHFPLIGEVKVGGKTLVVLEKELKDKITPFVSKPELSVMVNQVNSLLIFVIGRVNTPGKYVLNMNFNVLQALATAGGLNRFAKRDKIKVYRESNGKTDIFHFNYDEVMDEKNLGQNIKLERGDVVVVP